MLSCAFIGHKDFSKNIKDLLYSEIENLIVKEKGNKRRRI